MTGTNAQRPDWPEEAPSAAPAAPRKELLGRIGRAIGDAALTVGMSKGMTGGRSGDDARAISNVMLFGEGRKKGDEATRGSGRD